jgi:hypothetical protein
MRAFAKIDILNIYLPEGVRLVKVAEALIDQWGTRTEDGRKLTAQFSDSDEPGISELIFTATDDGKMIIDRQTYDLLCQQAAGKEADSGTTSTDNTTEGGESSSKT